MKKDIDIPEVRGIFVAAVQEQHPEFGTLDWNVYLINESGYVLETVLIRSVGTSSEKRSTTLRHRLDELPDRSFAKVEFLHEDLLALKNCFSVSYFARGKLFHKDFVFSENSIRQSKLQPIPLIEKSGILIT